MGVNPSRYYREKEATENERKALVRDCFIKLIPFEIHVAYSRNCTAIIVSCCTREATGWWLNTIRKSYPMRHIYCNKIFVTLEPEYGVYMKINRHDGTLIISGKSHWEWFICNFDEIIRKGLPECFFRKSFIMSINHELLLDDGLRISDMMEFLPMSGCIRHGPSFIYKLWKCLLDDWLNQGGTIFILSPLIDSRRLADILLLLIKHSHNGSKIKMLTLEKCDGEKKFCRVLAKAKQRVLSIKAANGIPLISGVRLSYGIDERLQVRHANFHCKIIANIRTDGLVELMLTSANFHKWHLDVDNGDFVQRMTLTLDQFNKNYLQHIGFIARY